jgi:hypothetical protein
MDMARERPLAAAAAAAGAAAAGLFLWSKRTQISDQLSQLSDQIGQWRNGDSFEGGDTSSFASAGMSETGGGNASLGRSSGGGGMSSAASGRGRAKKQPTT